MTRNPRKRRRRGGFTLVELMIVVAIIGILAAMATAGIYRYLNAARISEAKQAVGNISRSAHAAYQEEIAPTESLTEGTESAQIVHQLCDSASPVPATVPLSRKYQPDGSPGKDFQAGDEQTGWACLKFSISHPIYYQYSYVKGDSPMAPDNPAKCPSGQECYEAAAKGDVDGDGFDYSRVARTGFVNPATGELREATLLYVEDEPE